MGKRSNPDETALLNRTTKSIGKDTNGNQKRSCNGCGKVICGSGTTRYFSHILGVKDAQDKKSIAPCPSIGKFPATDVDSMRKIMAEKTEVANEKVILNRKRKNKDSAAGFRPGQQSITAHLTGNLSVKAEADAAVADWVFEDEMAASAVGTPAFKTMLDKVIKAGVLFTFI